MSEPTLDSGVRTDGLLLVISGGIEAERGLARLRARGWRLAVLDGDPRAPGYVHAEEVLHVSTYDLGAAARAAIELNEREPILGVLSIAADVPHTVAHVARCLGLPGIEQETARLAMDKLEMKRAFRRAGVPVPWFAEVDSPAELERALEQLGRTLVIKPVDSRGARGVLLVDSATDLEWAFRHALAPSPSGRVMVEEYLPGPQLSSESMLVDGRSFTAGLSDRNYELLESTRPFVIENGGDQPSRWRETVLPKVDALIERAAAAIGLTDGVLKGDLVLDEAGEPIVIEVAPRLSGGYFCTDQIPLSTGVDLVQAQALVATGTRPSPESLTPARWDATCIRYFFPPRGRVTRIDGFEALASLPGVEHQGLALKVGDEVPPLTDHTRRAGFVLVTGASRAEARERATEAVRSLRYQVEPPLEAAVSQSGPKAGIAGRPATPPASDRPQESKGALR